MQNNMYRYDLKGHDKRFFPELRCDPCEVLIGQLLEDSSRLLSSSSVRISRTHRHVIMFSFCCLEASGGHDTLGMLWLQPLLPAARPLSHVRLIGILAPSRLRRKVIPSHHPLESKAISVCVCCTCCLRHICYPRRRHKLSGSLSVVHVEVHEHRRHFRKGLVSDFRCDDSQCIAEQVE